MTGATFYGVLFTGLHDENGPSAPTADGYQKWDPQQFPPLQRFRIDHVTAFNNGLYGIYAFDSQHGVITDSYASGSADSGFYVGQCRDCDILVTGNVAERNAVGFENANASDSLVDGRQPVLRQPGRADPAVLLSGGIRSAARQPGGRQPDQRQRRGRLPRPGRRGVRNRHRDQRRPVQHRGTQPDLRPRPSGHHPHQHRGHPSHGQPVPRQRPGRKRRRHREPIRRAHPRDRQLRHRHRNGLAHDAARGVVGGVRRCGRTAAGVDGHRRRAGRTPRDEFQEGHTAQGPAESGGSRPRRPESNRYRPPSPCPT